MTTPQTVFRMALVLYGRTLTPVEYAAIQVRLASARPFAPEEQQRWLAQMRPWAEARGCWDRLLKGMQA